MTSLTPLVITHAGKRLVGQLALPAGDGPAPGVLVMSNAHGLGPQARESALELAGLGYVALATDMYGEGAYHAEPGAAGEDYMALMRDGPKLRERTVAWLAPLADLPRVDGSRLAAIGYCFGGRCVLELARSGADVRAVVSYHGILTTHEPAAAGAFRGEVVAFCGGQDPYAPGADIETLAREMQAAGVRHQITVFSDTPHGFTDTDSGRLGMPGIAYDRRAHRMSWAATLALLEDALAG